MPVGTKLPQYTSLVKKKMLMSRSRIFKYLKGVTLNILTDKLQNLYMLKSITRYSMDKKQAINYSFLTKMLTVVYLLMCFYFILF